MSGEVLLSPVSQDEAIPIDAIESPYSSIPSLRNLIYSRGLPPAPVVMRPKEREDPPNSASGGSR